MPCVPAPVRLPVAGWQPDAFAFSPGAGATGRTVENLAALWSMPWIAFWALTMETLDPANYRL